MILFNWWPFNKSSKNGPTPFFIFCLERSGSSHLGNTLAAHDQILCRLENFDSEALGEASELPPQNFPIFKCGSWAYRRRINKNKVTLLDPSDEQALEYLDEIFSQPFQACGFKYKFPTQVICFPEVLDALKNRPNIHVICLTRKNVLKQAISRQNMKRLLELKQEGEVKLSSRNLLNEVELPPLHLDIQQAVGYANLLQEQQAFMIETAKAFKRVFYVDYEEMLHDHDGTFQRMVDFLGVDPQPIHSRFRKSTPDDLEKAIANYDELVEAVKGTPISPMLGA